MLDELPQHLQIYFKPRPPVKYLSPSDYSVSERKTPYITGIASLIQLADSPPSDLDTYIPTETIQVQRIKKKKEKKKKQEEYLQKGLLEWNPDEDENIKGDPFKTLFVGRLNYDTTEEKLAEIFEKFGPIKRIRIVYEQNDDKNENSDTTISADINENSDPNMDTKKNADEKENVNIKENINTKENTGTKINKNDKKQSRGYAFIVFEKERDLKNAIDSSKNLIIDDRKVIVDVERGRTVRNWKPRRLGGGLGGRHYTKKDILQSVSSFMNNVRREQSLSYPSGPASSRRSGGSSNTNSSRGERDRFRDRGDSRFSNNSSSRYERESDRDRRSSYRDRPRERDQRFRSRDYGDREKNERRSERDDFGYDRRNEREDFGYERRRYERDDRESQFGARNPMPSRIQSSYNSRVALSYDDISDSKKATESKREWDQGKIDLRDPKRRRV